MELRIDILAQTTCHAHKAQHVQRHKGNKEADNPEPERALAPGFIQGKAERFREPVGHTSHTTKHHTTDNHVMEVCDQEQAVMQHEVCAWYCQQNTGHTTDREGDQEANCPQHRRVHLNAALIHGEKPVKDLNAGWDSDNHRHDAEEGVDVCACTHRKEVVQPNDKRQHGNGDGSPNQ